MVPAHKSNNKIAPQYPVESSIHGIHWNKLDLELKTYFILTVRKLWRILYTTEETKYFTEAHMLPYPICFRQLKQGEHNLVPLSNIQSAW